jgi:hypothetical protein
LACSYPPGPNPYPFGPTPDKARSGIGLTTGQVRHMA